MRKLKLDLDELMVESFATGRNPAEGFGTVKGRTGALCVDDTNYDTCGGGGASAETACGPCPPDTLFTHCGQNTCPYTCDDATCQSCPRPTVCMDSCTGIAACCSGIC
jgi:hypothetical protein